MKITLNVDCSPEEARQFFGLPDVKPLQAALMKEVEGRLSAALKAMDPAEMMKTWLPATMKGFGELQEMLLAQMREAGRPKK
ncbi:MAG TPA: DUF6489 family protein [Stellaceae bacterium]|nr:DUF6489 family protein [Stellaceae bacterium]